MFFNLFKKNHESISVHDLDKKLGKINLIDIREPYEYKIGHVPTARNIPMNTIIANADKYLDKAQEYFIICQSGGRSSGACSRLTDMGYKVKNVSGGTGSYLKPLER